MLALFKYNRFGNSLLLFVYALILRLPSMVSDHVDIAEHSVILDNGILNWPTSTIIGQIIIAFFIFIQAAMINRLVIRNRVMLDINLYPGLFYILLISFTPGNYIMHLLILVNFIAIYSISEIYQTFKNLDNNGRIYNSGVLTSLAALFYSPYILFSIFNYITIASLRALKLRERLQLLLGLLSPIFICGVWYTWGNRLSIFPSQLFTTHLDFFSFKRVHPFLYDYIILGIFTLITLWTLANYRSFTTKKNMQAIKKVNILFWFILFVAISAVLQYHASISHFILLSIPLSVCLAMSFAKMKRRSIAEVLHMFLFLGSLFLNAKILSII